MSLVKYPISFLTNSAFHKSLEQGHNSVNFFLPFYNKHCLSSNFQQHAPHFHLRLQQTSLNIHISNTILGVIIYVFSRKMDSLEQGCPTPGPLTGTGLRPVRNQAAQQEVSDRQAREASSAAPHCSHYRLNHSPPPTRGCGKIVFHGTGPWCQSRWGPLLQSSLLFFESLPELPSKFPSQQYQLFLAYVSVLFQLLPITQFQSCFQIQGYLLQQHPTSWYQFLSQFRVL